MDSAFVVLIDEIDPIYKATAFQIAKQIPSFGSLEDKCRYFCEEMISKH